MKLLWWSLGLGFVWALVTHFFLTPERGLRLFEIWMRSRAAALGIIAIQIATHAAVVYAILFIASLVVGR